LIWFRKSISHFVIESENSVMTNCLHQRVMNARRVKADMAIIINENLQDVDVQDAFDLFERINQPYETLDVVLPQASTTFALFDQSDQTYTGNEATSVVNLRTAAQPGRRRLGYQRSQAAGPAAAKDGRDD
jgi:hypothetical protein